MTRRVRHMRGIWTFFLTVTICSPAEPDPSILTFKQPIDLVWTGTGRIKQVVLYGDPTKPGLYAVLRKWPPGTGSRPHTLS